MKTTIRLGTFETNSSSTHSLVVCTKKEFELFKIGELIFNRYAAEFVPTKVYEEAKESEDFDDYEFCTYDEYFEDDELESYEEEYTSESGDGIVIFGNYGYC